MTYNPTRTVELLAICDKATLGPWLQGTQTVQIGDDVAILDRVADAEAIATLPDLAAQLRAAHYEIERLKNPSISRQWNALIMNAPTADGSPLHLCVPSDGTRVTDVTEYVEPFIRRSGDCVDPEPDTDDGDDLAAQLRAARDEIERMTVFEQRSVRQQEFIETQAQCIREKNAELERMKKKPPVKGDPVFDAPLYTKDAEFDSFVASLPEQYWARYDLSALRLGWHYGRERLVASVEVTSLTGKANNGSAVRDCEYCGGSGILQNVIGEWIGECHKCWPLPFGWPSPLAVAAQDKQRNQHE